MRSLANLTVVAPADAAALEATVAATTTVDGPVYIRTSRGRDPEVYDRAELADFELGRARRVRQGTDAVLIATGSMVHPSRAAAEQLAGSGIDVGVIDMHTVKPLDEEAVIEAAGSTDLLVTVEEHNVLGGLGGAVAEVLASNGSGTRLKRHGIEDLYALIGPPTHLYAHYRLDGEGIAAVVREELGAAAPVETS
jgi:transketolase